MAFEFLKRNKEDAPPDIGQEEMYDAEKAEKEGVSEEEGIPDEIGAGPGEEAEPVKDVVGSDGRAVGVVGAGAGVGGQVVGAGGQVGASNEANKLEFEKINAKIDSVKEWIKQFYERFSYVSETMGGIRTMAMNNEKDISRISLEAEKAVDIVKEVKPERLRIDYQKTDVRLQELSERLLANKQFTETIMSEVKDLRGKSSIFVGTEALLRLNEDVKRDLIEMQKLSGKVRMNADKSEQLFVELRKGFTETQKVNQVISNFNVSHSGLKDEVARLKIDYSDILKQKDFNDFKKSLNNKFAVMDNSLSELGAIKETNEKMARLIETTLSVARNNKEDIADIAITIGNDRIKRVSDYENQLASILSIVDSIAGQVSEVKKKLGMTVKKIPVKSEKIPVKSEKIPVKEGKKIVGKELKMKHVDVHPEISKHLISPKPEIPEKIKQIQREHLKEEKLPEVEREVGVKKMEGEVKNKLGLLSKLRKSPVKEGKEVEKDVGVVGEPKDEIIEEEPMSEDMRREKELMKEIVEEERRTMRENIEDEKERKSAKKRELLEVRLENLKKARAVREAERAEEERLEEEAIKEEERLEREEMEEEERKKEEAKEKRKKSRRKRKGSRRRKKSKEKSEEDKKEESKKEEESKGQEKKKGVLKELMETLSGKKGKSDEESKKEDALKLVKELSKIEEEF